MTFDFVTRMTSSHLLLYADKQITFVQKTPSILQNFEKDL